MPTPRFVFGPRADDLTSRFARELVAARATAGLTQRQLARRAKISQSFVSQAERGQKVPSLVVMHRLASATGHDLAIRLYPADGVRLRDSGQLRVAELIRGALHTAARVRLEVPVAPAPDRRAADMVLQTTTEGVQVEIERALLDFQAQLRAAQLKRSGMADQLGRAVRLVIAVPDTRRNRAVVDNHRVIVESALPIPSRRIWSSLRSGDRVGGDGLLWVRLPSSAR
ncbi:MAG: helix-turn-helix transcriptional regulator [Chloroflexi bacterium]|nr:helix-turn-helix transcriptional regulator [Chloroflexota bacterium]